MEIGNSMKKEIWTSIYKSVSHSAESLVWDSVSVDIQAWAFSFQESVDTSIEACTRIL